MIGSIVLILRLVMMIALYGFLGFALITLLRDFQRTGESLVHRRVPGISLAVQFGSEPARILHFNQAEISIGRNPLSDVILEDETISARHGLLSYHHGQWWFEDLDSTNGTKLNKAPVTMPTVVTNDDVIQCGQNRITITLAASLPVATTRRLEKQG